MFSLFLGIRGKENVKASIDDATVSMAMVRYVNMNYCVGRGFDIDIQSGRIYDREAMQLWGRRYEPGWEPKI